MELLVVIFALFVTNLTLVGTLIYVLIQQQKERRELYDRIMARNIVEYKDNVEVEEEEDEDEEEVEIPIEDAKEELING